MLEEEISTEHRVEVVRLGPVHKHENADSLSYTLVHGGYPVVFRTGDYHEGDLAVYIPVDSMVPIDQPRFSFLKNPRIKAAKIRGMFSMGLLTAFDEEVHRKLVFGRGVSDFAAPGQEVSELLGITQYEPPRKAVKAHGSLGGTMGDQDAEEDLQYMAPYIDLQPLRRNRTVIGPDEIVVCTEKIHGANARYTFQAGRLWAGSRRTIKKDTPNSDWWNAARRYNLTEKLSALNNAPWTRGLILYGELFGRVQDLSYGEDGVDFVLFDMFDTVLRRWLTYHEMRGVNMILDLGLKVVPLLYEGPFKDIPADLAEGKSLLGGDHVREGYVVKPYMERFDPSVGRVALKFHGEGYLTRGEGKAKPKKMRGMGAGLEAATPASK